MKDRYTLLFVIKGSALNRGMNTGIENLAWGLAETGCDVHILSGGTYPTSHAYDVPESVTYYFTGRPGVPSGFSKSFLDLSEQFDFDAIIGWIKNIAPLTHVIKKERDGASPRFIANQGAMTKSLESGQFLTQILRRIKLNASRVIGNEASLSEAFRGLLDPRSYYVNIDQVVSITRAVQDNVQTIYGIPLKKTSVVYRGVDTQLFKPVYGLKNSCSMPLRLLYTGNVIPTKGISDIVDALKFISTPVHLVLCGNGSPDYVDKLVERLSSSKDGVKRILEWRGALGREDVISEYQSADLFVFCSSSEGLGKSLIEAMACGLPVVVSDIPPFKEVVEDSVNGLVVPAGSFEGIATAIDKYLTDPNLRQKYGHNARNTVLSRFSKRCEIESWLRILHEHTVSYK